jgi:hypothetical protein
VGGYSPNLVDAGAKPIAPDAQRSLANVSGPYLSTKGQTVYYSRTREHFKPLNHMPPWNLRPPSDVVFSFVHKQYHTVPYHHHVLRCSLAIIIVHVSRIVLDIIVGDGSYRMVGVNSIFCQLLIRTSSQAFRLFPPRCQPAARLRR